LATEMASRAAAAVPPGWIDDLARVAAGPAAGAAAPSAAARLAGKVGRGLLTDQIWALANVAIVLVTIGLAAGHLVPAGPAPPARGGPRRAPPPPPARGPPPPRPLPALNLPPRNRSRRERTRSAGASSIPTASRSPAPGSTPISRTRGTARSSSSPNRPRWRP